MGQGGFKIRDNYQHELQPETSCVHMPLDKYDTDTALYAIF